MKTTYHQAGDFLLPDLTYTAGNYGKYGTMRKDYLRKNKPVKFSSLVFGGLEEHLETIDRQANERMDLLVSQMAEREGVTEELKARDMVEWVRRMNNIRSRAEEVVLEELIYN